MDDDKFAIFGFSKPDVPQRHSYLMSQKISCPINYDELCVRRLREYNKILEVKLIVTRFRESMVICVTLINDTLFL